MIRKIDEMIEEGMIDRIGEKILEKGREIEKERVKELEREHVNVHVIDLKSVGEEDQKKDEKMKEIVTRV